MLLACSAAATAFGVPDVVNQVSQDSYRCYLDDQLYTHLGDSRGYYGAQHDAAQTNILNFFQTFGLAASLDPFYYSGRQFDNVVGVHWGATRPDDIYVVGAHFDSAETPGADDNGSGVAGVLEAARVLSSYDFQATLVFIAFDMEERGLLGSGAYAAEHAGDNIEGMVSLDMIAYNPDRSDRAWVYGRTASDPIKNSLAQAASLYGGLHPSIGGDVPYSDQASFEAYGFQASLLIEYSVWSNPYYHKAADSVDTPNYIDYLYATKMTRATVGYLAGAAGLVPEPGSLTALGSGLVCLVVLVRRRRVQCGSAGASPCHRVLGS